MFPAGRRLRPRDADGIYWIGGVRQRMGQIEAAEAAYTETAHLQPIRRPAAKYPAHNRVLALYSPLAVKLPTRYLYKDAAYYNDTLALFASAHAMSIA